MNRKLRIILMLNVIAFTLLLANISSSQAATREWNAGGIYIWSRQSLSETNLSDNEQGVNLYQRLETDTEYKYNLTAIDTVSKEYDAYISDTGSTYFDGGIDYAAEDFVEDELPLTNSVDVDFHWNFDTNETVLYSFDFALDPFKLIEPDWAVVNTGFAELFNLSEIVDTVIHPFDPIIYNLTLGDTFGNASLIKIQGVKNNLNKSIGKFTATNTKFSFEFDFTGKMHFRVYNGTAGYYNYYLCDLYTIFGEFSYSDGGILQKAVYRYEYQQTHDDLVSHFVYTSTMVFGTLQKLTGYFALFAIIPALGLLAVIVRVKRKK